MIAGQRTHDRFCRCTVCKPAPVIGERSESLLRFHVGTIGLSLVGVGVIVGRAKGWL